MHNEYSTISKKFSDVKVTSQMTFQNAINVSINVLM